MLVNVGFGNLVNAERVVAVVGACEKNYSECEGSRQAYRCNARAQDIFRGFYGQ